jgi:tRNA uracil 4-sulfurtransferase
MTSIAYDLIVCRYGELFLKGDNRARFEALLQHNVRRVITQFPEARTDRGQGRLFVQCRPETAHALVEQIRRVPGLSSVSPAILTAKDLPALSAAALGLVQQKMTEHVPRTFRIKARRSDKQFPWPSPEIGREIGAHVYEATGLAVDLTNPELTVGVEVGPHRCFVYLDRIAGAGGLPVGVSGQVALLLSGGIDSPVAGYLLQKRGCTLQAIYFHSPPYTGSRTRTKVEQLAQKLAWAQEELVLQVVRFTALQEAIRDHAPLEMAVVLYRRAMMRISSELARRGGSQALATGENLGQVASQTLSNLATIEKAATLPVLRPLLTYDKTETIALAQHLGTFALSIEPYDDCCSLFVPRHPLTRAKESSVIAAEERLQVQQLLAEAIETSETVSIKR